DDFRDQLIPIQHALAKRSMRAGFVIVERAVGVNEMDVRDLAFEFLEKLQGAAFQCFFLTWLAGADRSAHVGVAGVIEDAEVWITKAPHFVDNGQNFRWFVKSESRLEFPAN